MSQSPQERMLTMSLAEWRKLVCTLSLDDLYILNRGLHILAHHCRIAGMLRQHGMTSRRQEIVQRRINAMIKEETTT